MKRFKEDALILATIVSFLLACIVLTPIGLIFLGKKAVGMIWHFIIKLLSGDVTPGDII